MLHCAKKLLILLIVTSLSSCASQTSSIPAPQAQCVVLPETDTIQPTPRSSQTESPNVVTQWQPAVPPRLMATSLQKAISPEGRFEYYVVGLATGYTIIVTENRRAYFFVYDHLDVVYTLSEQEYADLTETFVNEHLDEQAYLWSKPTPTGAIVDQDTHTIVYRTAQGNESVMIEGSPDLPKELALIEAKMRELADTLVAARAAKPPIVLRYFVDQRSHSFSMQIDCQGNIFFNNTDGGRLSTQEMTELLQTLKNSNVQQMAASYLPPPEQRRSFERRASLEYTVNGETKIIEAVTGATIPQKLATIWERLTTIYMRFYPQ